MRLVDRFRQNRLNSNEFTVAERYALARVEKRTTLSNPSQWLMDFFGNQTSAGQNVTETTAMSLSAVHACVRVISEGLSSMPFKLYEQQGNDRFLDKSSTVARLLDEPNPFDTGVSFRKYMAANAVLTGNAYAYIFRNGAGEPINLLPLQNCTVITLMSNEGSLFYEITTNDPIYRNIPKVVSSYDILHIKGLCMADQFTAISPIRYHAQMLGTDLAAWNALAGQFKSGTKKYMLNSEKPWNTEQQKSTRESMEKVLNNDSLVFSVPSGVSAQTISMTPQEAGYLDAIGATNKDIARIFGVPASIIGADDGAIKASVEQDALNFLNQTLNPWAVSIEAEYKKKLLPERDKPNKFFKHNFNSLMRADAAARAEFYTKMQSIGVLSANDIRSLEDLNGYESGKEYYVNAALVPTTQMNDWIQAKIDSMDATQEQTNNPNGNN